jgi:putative phage-type endonuclease
MNSRRIILLHDQTETAIAVSVGETATKATIKGKGMADKSPEWHAERRKGIGGSDAGAIMSGRWLELWLQKTGRAEPEDLSGILAVQLGTHTEALNLLWFERETGRPVIAQGTSLTHPYYSFMRVTLDGLVEQPDAIVEAKWCGAFNKIEEIEQRYMAQCHHNMLVCGYDRAFLSVITGKPSYELIEIRRDDDYAATLLQYEEDFWWYVETDTAPPDRESVAAPIKPSPTRIVSIDLENPGSNWEYSIISPVNEYVNTFDEAKKNGAARDNIKSMLPDDVSLCRVGLVDLKRDKRGSLTISLERLRNV